MSKSILDVVHESARNLYQKKLIDAVTMHEFDALCLPNVYELSPKEIQELREKEKVSQPVFAMLLNVALSTVKKWETGEKHPSGISLKLLNLIQANGISILLSH